METFSGSVELIRLTFIFGALAAVLYKKLSGITPGGIIVPAFLAIILDDNLLWFVVLLLIAGLTTLIYKLFFGSVAMLHRWMVLTNISIATTLTLGTQYLLKDSLTYSEISSFGFIVPGLIASTNQLTNPKNVAKGVLYMTALTYCFGWLLFNLLPYSLTSQLTVQLASFSPLVASLSTIAVPLSLLAAALSFWVFKARSGGYIIAPIVAAVVAGSLAQFAMFLVATLFVFFAVNQILKNSLIVGLDRFVLILFISTILVTIMDQVAVASQMSGYLASPLMLILAMTVWVNDLCLQPIKKSFDGFSVPVFASSLLIKAVR